MRALSTTARYLITYNGGMILCLKIYYDHRKNCESPELCSSQHRRSDGMKIHINKVTMLVGNEG